MPDYQLGTTDPATHADVGAGEWNSKPTELITHAKKAAILDILPLAMVYPGVDAVKHMYHYLGNTGADYTINLEGMVKDVPSAGRILEAEIEAAKRFVESLPVGAHDICSGDNDAGYNTKEESANWFFAIGGYTYWGKGTASVGEANGSRSYQLTFRYKFFDRYNWDGGKHVTIGGITITDEAMAEFHRQGVAREFNCYGSLDRLVIWGAPLPTPAPVGPYTPPPVQPPPLPGPKPPAPVQPPSLPGPKPPVPVPPTPPDPGPRIHVVRSGENLSVISAKYYGTPAKWTTIYNANKMLIGPNPNLIYPGQHLLIP